MKEIMPPKIQITVEMKRKEVERGKESTVYRARRSRRNYRRVVQKFINWNGK